MLSKRQSSTHFNLYEKAVLSLSQNVTNNPPETQSEYVVVTIDVKEQNLKVFLDTIQIEQYQYRLHDLFQ